MNKKLVVIWLISAVLLVTGCVDKTSSPVVRQHDTDIFYIPVGQSAFYDAENIEIGFDTVLSDDRIPNCTTSSCGTALLRMWIKQPRHDTAFIEASTHGANPAMGWDAEFTYEVGDYLLTLRDLEPKPDTGVVLQYDDYVAEVQVAPHKVTDEVDGSVIVCEYPPDSIWRIDYDLHNAFIESGALTIRAAHGGGCEDHYFLLYMSPPVFRQTQPPQADLYLRHYSNGDVCRAYLRPTLRFDLAPIRRLYPSEPGVSGRIVLNIHNFPGEYPDKMSVIYRF